MIVNCLYAIAIFSIILVMIQINRSNRKLQNSINDAQHTIDLINANLHSKTIEAHVLRLRLQEKEEIIGEVCIYSNQLQNRMDLLVKRVNTIMTKNNRLIKKSQVKQKRRKP